MGMVIGIWRGWSDLATVTCAVALAFAFGYAATITSRTRAGRDRRSAVKIDRHRFLGITLLRARRRLGSGIPRKPLADRA
jgi:hypothetical protein